MCNNITLWKEIVYIDELKAYIIESVSRKDNVNNDRQISFSISRDKPMLTSKLKIRKQSEVLYQLLERILPI